MVYVLSVLGVFIITCGVVIKKKKWLWIHLGIRKKELAVELFTKHICTVDIIFGILFVLTGVFYKYISMPSLVIIAICIIYTAVNFYVENKYTIK